MEINGKTEELLIKQLKIFKRNMLTNSIKRPNLRIMGIEEGEEVPGKGICNIFNKIITEKFPNLEKTIPFRYRKYITTQIDTSLPDLFTASQSPSHIDLCHFKVTVLAPLK
jgi:hypothetical protein